jgi:hypothetical protein
MCLPDKSDRAGLPDKSDPFTGLVRFGIFNSTFDQCFERNLLTVSLINPILLPLAL